MNKRFSFFSLCCVVLLFLFSAFMAWYLPSASSLRANIEEISQSLETSRGRESKQQYEYDKAVEELPLIQAELAEKAPLAEQAAEAVSVLRSRKKELLAEKKELESMLPESGAEQEDGSDE